MGSMIPRDGELILMIAYLLYSLNQLVCLLLWVIMSLFSRLSLPIFIFQFQFQFHRICISSHRIASHSIASQSMSLTSHSSLTHKGRSARSAKPARLHDCLSIRTVSNSLTRPSVSLVSSFVSLVLSTSAIPISNPRNRDLDQTSSGPFNHAPKPSASVTDSLGRPLNPY